MAPSQGYVKAQRRRAKAEKMAGEFESITNSLDQMQWIIKNKDEGVHLCFNDWRTVVNIEGYYTPLYLLDKLHETDGTTVLLKAIGITIK